MEDKPINSLFRSKPRVTLMLLVRMDTLRQTNTRGAFGLGAMTRSTKGHVFHPAIPGTYRT